MPAVLVLLLGWAHAHAGTNASGKEESGSAEPTTSGQDGGSVGESEATEPAPVPSGVVERVTVEAPADRTPLLDRTSFSTVLLREDLDRNRLSMTEALRQSPGVQVRAFGGLGEFATVSIRGSSSEQVEIFVDGVAQRPATGGGVNLADLPSLALERIEIYRGFTPAWFGPSSLAGVVSITTRSPDQPATDIRASYGSFDSVRVGGLAALPAGSWNLLGSVEVSHTDGDFGFFGTNHPQRRENNANDSLQLLGRASRPLAGSETVKKIEITNSLLVRDQEVPGPQSFPSPEANFDQLRDTLQVEGSLSSPWGGWSADPALYATYETQHYENLGPGTAGDEENRFTTIGLRSPVALQPTAGMRWIVSPEVRHERAKRRDDFLAPQVERFEAERDTFFLSAGVEWETAGDRLLVTPSLRWTSLNSSFDGLTPGAISTRSHHSEEEISGKLGLRWRLTPSLALRANAGSFFREPSLIELYGNSGLVQGNPTLQSERGEHADAGLSWSWLPPPGAGSHVLAANLEGSVFRTRADELILLFPTGGLTVKPQNSGAARITGVELSGALSLRGGWRFDLGYTHERTEDTSGRLGRKILPGRPADELHAGAHLQRGRWSGLYRYSFIGNNYLDPQNTKSVPDRHLHTVGLGFAPSPAWELSVEVENVGDQRAGDLAGFPLPGRLVIVEVRFRP